ncbi:hypothetical protein A3780_08135 [Kosakonia radicincitans]|uniref:Uncharacterized protein n=2 Tax=Enterobacteriaceae TaxID=543 RepID=A0AAX2EZS1_9ENTR|nr:hypothetical protein A3780_08135 [Kosakonia radicincitans]KDE37457.1 hypothetical protein AW40_06615 [Kosakonia radicincitans UMEnt01/12]PTA93159.1 hypothetical protein CWM66_03730 [Kosakonia sp. H7A]SFF40529.1 hypothetical protein SAMN03159468_05069 [Kosakonia radicincitans]SFR26781.1 hypothetical protein SAMN03159514_05086 [Kosakonia radicincitans]
MEALFDEALQEAYLAIHEKIMETLLLDQINFDEHSPTDFNIAIHAIRNCLARRKAPKDWQKWQKEVWEHNLEPSVRQDFRYQG